MTSPIKLQFNPIKSTSNWSELFVVSNLVRKKWRLLFKMIIFYLPGLTNQPKSNTSDSDEDDETASQHYLKQVGFLYIFFLWMCESLVEKTKKSVEHKRMRSFYFAQ